MPTGKYKRITLTKFDKMINLTIDDIARDVEITFLLSEGGRMTNKQIIR